MPSMNEETLPEVEQTEVVESASTEPEAEVTTEAAPEPAPEPVDETDKFQKRINQLTAKRYEEKRRADELQAKLDAIQSQPEPEPTLEKFDYDEEAFNKAQVAFQVKQELSQLQQQVQQAQQARQQEEANRAFNQKVQEFGKADYVEIVSQIPPLPTETIPLIQQAGPEVAYYLGQHLDVAASIAESSPYVAAMQIGEISARLKSEKPKPQPSKAPDPVTPLTSSGSLSDDVGSEMSMEAWMAKFGD